MEDAAVNDVISGFYDRHPYPPPVTDLDDYRDQWNEQGRRRAEHHLLFPSRPFGHEMDLLVAGCGTSQAARHALRWPQARVVGIDASETSLQHSEGLRRRYGLENLELHHLPIERVADLDQTFDVVVCTGVLHHLADPDVGLRTLREVLRPTGAMHVMVYARYGRLGVEMMQKYGRMLGIGTREDEVRDLAATLAEIPDGHPLAPLLRSSPDLRRLDSFADALLNPRERSYSVPELLDYVDRNGLVFGRWYRQAPYRPQCGTVAGTPHATALAALPQAEQFAAMELFRGTMLRHSCIVHRSDLPPGQLGSTSSDSTPWLNVVPIRVADTILVEERLPSGAAAVLINPTHTFTDIVLPVDEGERRLVEAIDGVRTIHELAALAGTGDAGERLVAFFRRLWWYDQVVFDSSAPTGQGWSP